MSLDIMKSHLVCPKKPGSKISRKEIEEEWDVGSVMLAALFKSSACDIHENCDGSCSNIVTYTDPPLLGITGLFVPMMMQIARSEPSSATAQDVPRNVEWVRTQNFPSLEYSEIHSSDGEIRLLRVRKAIFRSDVIECEMIVTKLDQCPSYQALSYCCGTSEKSEVMLCNNATLNIQPTLSAALKAFRESSKLNNELLWTDGVCINQENKGELGEQIPLMRRIYTEATGVFVHLGLAERLMSQGIDLMYRLNILQMHLKHPEDLGPISMEEIKLPVGKCWTEYAKLYQSAWISRTWILQEIALSQRANLGIGRYVIDWEVLEGSFHFLREQNLIQGLWLQEQEAIFGVMNFTRLQHIRQIARAPDKSSLLKVLQATRNFRVTDPRDKILGVLGLLGELPAQLKGVSEYRLTTAEIYHRTALYLLKTQFPPDVFAHAGLQRHVGQLDMPS